MFCVIVASACCHLFLTSRMLHAVSDLGRIEEGDESESKT